MSAALTMLITQIQRLTQKAGSLVSEDHEPVADRGENGLRKHLITKNRRHSRFFVDAHAEILAQPVVGTRAMANWQHRKAKAVLSCQWQRR